MTVVEGAWRRADTAAPPEPRPPSDAKVANRNVSWDFGWEIAHGFVTRRPPIPLYTMVPRTEGYAYDVGVLDLSIVKDHFLSRRAKP